MRRLYSYRNRLSVRGTTAVTDERGANVYLINGRWGMHAGVMSVYSASGFLEAEIKQRSLGMFPKFDLYRKRRYAGSIRRYYGVSREMLLVKKLSWLIIGNLSTYNYRVFHGRECIMTINEVQLASGDYLEFTIAHEEDEALLLCVVSILDYWARSGKKMRRFGLGFVGSLAFD